MAFLKKPLFLAFFSSYMNWLFLVLSIIGYGILSFLADHPELVRRPALRKTKVPEEKGPEKQPEKRKEERLPLY